LALGHTSFALGPQEIAKPEGHGWIAAAGALYSTASDLAKWDLSLMDGKVLKPDSWSVMTSPRKLADGRVSDYGCGLGISTKSGMTVLAHSGAVSGYLAYNAMIPGTRSAVVVLANCEDGAVIGKLRATLLALLLPKPADIPKVSGHSAIEAAKDFLSRMQSGKVDRTQLGEEFGFFLSPEKLRGAESRLKLYGKPKKVEIANGLEASRSIQMTGLDLKRNPLIFEKCSQPAVRNCSAKELTNYIATERFQNGQRDLRLQSKHGQEPNEYSHSNE